MDGRLLWIDTLLVHSLHILVGSLHLYYDFFGISEISIKKYDGKKNSHGRHLLLTEKLMQVLLNYKKEATRTFLWTNDIRRKSDCIGEWRDSDRQMSHRKEKIWQ